MDSTNTTLSNNSSVQVLNNNPAQGSSKSSRIGTALLIMPILLVILSLVLVGLLHTLIPLLAMLALIMIIALVVMVSQMGSEKKSPKQGLESRDIKQIQPQEQTGTNSSVSTVVMKRGVILEKKGDIPLDQLK